MGCGHGASTILMARAFPNSRFWGFLADTGVWMVFEPMAGDHVEENLNPVGRVYYSASTFIRTPASKAQEVGLGLGAQAGEARLSQVIAERGFAHIRRAAETPFNMVLKASR